MSDKQQSQGTNRSGGRGARAQAVLLKDRIDPTAHQMDEEAVRDAYRRWAPVYDYTFGMVSTAGRRHAVEIINGSQGMVLEVGVGTGLSLPDYKPHLDITGIDLAPEMLDKARARVKDAGMKSE